MPRSFDLPDRNEIGSTCARSPRLSIAVFAHNEEALIGSTLHSILGGGIDEDTPIHVLVNGCTDGTLEAVRAVSLRHPRVVGHEIALGDKANAWNHYVHRVAPDARMHAFVDGDVKVGAGAFDALEAALLREPDARAATGVPGSGRNRQAWIDQLGAEGGLAGNLYALHGDFVGRIRELGLNIPVGTIGEDGFVGAMAAFDLDPARGWDPARVAVARGALFYFDSFDWRRYRDVRTYLRRRVRYAVRYIQNRVLQAAIKSGGFPSLPPTIEELYTRHPQCVRLYWRGLDTVFLCVALLRIRERQARAH